MPFGEQRPIIKGPQASDEVQGHVWKTEPDRTEDKQTAASQDESDVEGHMNPVLNQELATTRSHERIADAERARRASGVHHTRDGGLLDKIRRRLGR